MASDQWVDWSPPWAPHVKGQFTPRERDVNGLCMAQTIRMKCTHVDSDGKVCGAEWQTQCTSGNVRAHINNFAKLHAHGDFANPPVVVRPGSKRTSIIEQQREREKSNA